MFHTLLLFAHLVATSAAIGTILVTDVRLLAKIIGYRVVILRPEPFEAKIIAVALAVLYLTGAALILVGLDANPAYLANGKLQGKLVLVLLLTANAFLLHRKVFPLLSRSQPVSQWKRSEWYTVAAAVSFSNSIWFFCAFLGIARAWNFNVSASFVVITAAAAWGVILFLVNCVLMLASRDVPKEQPDWIDSIKAKLNDFLGLRNAPPRNHVPRERGRRLSDAPPRQE